MIGTGVSCSMWARRFSAAPLDGGRSYASKSKIAVRSSTSGSRGLEKVDGCESGSIRGHSSQRPTDRWSRRRRTRRPSRKSSKALPAVSEPPRVSRRLQKERNSETWAGTPRIFEDATLDGFPPAGGDTATLSLSGNFASLQPLRETHFASYTIDGPRVASLDGIPRRQAFEQLRLSGGRYTTSHRCPASKKSRRSACTEARCAR